MDILLKHILSQKKNPLSKIHGKSFSLGFAMIAAHLRVVLFVNELKERI